jgi:ZIP family zinc transporter
MLTALLFGLAASSALVVGGVAGAFWRPPRLLVAVALAFASGALITALTFDLFEESFETGGVWSSGPGNDRAHTDGTDLIADDCEKIILGPHPDVWDANPFQPAPLGR